MPARRKPRKKDETKEDRLRRMTSEREEDRCARCGHDVAAAAMTWRSMTSYWGKIVGANYCSPRAAICRTKGCPRRCEEDSRRDPDAIYREVTRRQQKIQRQTRG